MSRGTERERKMSETTQQANALVGLDPRSPEPLGPLGLPGDLLLSPVNKYLS